MILKILFYVILLIAFTISLWFLMVFLTSKYSSLNLKRKVSSAKSFENANESAAAAGRNNFRF